MAFDTLDAFATLVAGFAPEDAQARAAATARNKVLTKPPAALGRLEEIALHMAAWQKTDKPTCDVPQILIFAGNHGVTAQGISAFPADVTVQMVANFSAGGAAINQLAKTFGAKLDVVALDLDTPTQDFSQGPAMSEDETVAALKAGFEAVDPKADALVVGEMGIGNTTAAAAIATALFGGAAADWAGRGTGLDDPGVAHKAAVIETALKANPDRAPLAVLSALGGREIAAMVGAMAAARHHSIPVILDGFIASAAAAVLYGIDASALDHVLAGHVSAEGAHPKLLAKMGKAPILDLGMRLGEGSGAAVALGVVKAAVACQSGMATFAEAGVSEGDG
ncbi:MAG: nicotinate-nucleotide--dimethylbenzimidazole phosphoribosyltransferase [Pseudomonadota bacterium]